MDEERVPVERIADDRLRRWLAACARDHATPLVLVAVGHDEHCGALQVYRTEDGPSDQEMGLLLQSVAQSFLAEQPREGTGRSVRGRRRG